VFTYARKAATARTTAVKIAKILAIGNLMRWD
jgi:hypothetical protein